MLFNSIDFAIFLPIVFLLYWFVANNTIRQQNTLIVAASYVFYGWWDWRFLSLILFSTIVDYYVGIGLSKETQQYKRKALLWSSLLVNLGFLGFFKYYNFFLDNFLTAFTFFGADISANSLNIILPVGISFYTFQTLSYSIDVYNRRLESTKDFVAFSAFVSFFPQLVAGPIERAKDLLPQFYAKRKFDYDKAVDGLRQILWGLFKKIVLADNCAEYANMIFNNSEDFSGSTLLIGAFMFTIQIYCDFSGYSDIALGTARLFGFKLSKNFDYPMFARDIAEFWRKWHISLSSWSRDYVYFPLGGSRGSTAKTIRNLYVIFVVIGFWHGANWKYIVYGMIHASYYLPLVLLDINRKNSDVVAQGRFIPKLKDLVNIGITFNFVLLARVFFRADNIDHALSYYAGIFSASLVMIPEFPDRSGFLFLMVLITIFIIIEWIGRANEYAIEILGLNWNRIFRLTFYATLVMAILWFGGREQQFVYFQF